MKLEKEIETEILEYLASQKDVFAWKVNTVGVYDPIKKVFRKPKSPFILSGVSDILGIHESGFMIAIEVKKPKGSKKSEDQIAFINKVNKMGGYACFARTVQEAEIFLEQTRSAIKTRMSGLPGGKGE